MMCVASGTTPSDQLAALAEDSETAPRNAFVGADGSTASLSRIDTLLLDASR